MELEGKCGIVEEPVHMSNYNVQIEMYHLLATH